MENNKDILIFKGKTYELIPMNYDIFVVHDAEKRYEDIGQIRMDTLMKAPANNPPVYECHAIRIKNQFYALKLQEDGER